MRPVACLVLFFGMAACGHPPLPPPPAETASNMDKCHALVETVCAVADGCRSEIGDRTKIAVTKTFCLTVALPKEKICDSGVSDNEYQRMDSCVRWIRDLYEGRASWMLKDEELNDCDAVAGVVDAIIHHNGMGLPPECVDLKDRITK